MLTLTSLKYLIDLQKTGNGINKGPKRKPIFYYKRKKRLIGKADVSVMEKEEGLL